MPWKEIEHAKQLLTSDGQIFIRIPNGFLHSHLLKIGALLGIENRISKLLVFHEYSFNLKYIKRLLTYYEFDNIEFQNIDEIVKNKIVCNRSNVQRLRAQRFRSPNPEPRTVNPEPMNLLLLALRKGLK